MVLVMLPIPINKGVLNMENVLEVKDLRCYFKVDEGILRAVDGVSYSVPVRKTLGVIGESGCGKSITAFNNLRIVPRPGIIVDGTINFAAGDGTSVNIAAMDPKGKTIRSIRGKKISMVFQEPMTSLSPVHTIGNQLTEAILLHRTRDKKEVYEIAIDMLTRVGISNPTQRMGEYAYQLSGGMRQRAMIAIALSCRPTLLIADEPTTALDVTVQSQILDLLLELKDQFGMSMQYITHDLGVIAQISDEVAVMYLGRIVEKGPVLEIFKRPQHPYTQLLLKSIPVLGRGGKKRLEVIQGNVPVPLNPKPQCGFFSRCPFRIKGKCDKAIPAMVSLSATHEARCFLLSEAEEQFFEYPKEK
jgi:oligopeptide/dipeptide ABC transporter ATP-binding protein